MTIENERDRLIDAALAHAVFEGMNRAAIRAGAQDLGLDPALIAAYLPGGGAELAAAYHRRGDRALAGWMADDMPAGGVTERIASAVMHRIRLTDREMLRAGATVLAQPQHAGLGAKLIWETADVIWNGLGDSSRDVNWYSKRATLSAVYGATVLYAMGDDSPDMQDTRAFLDRRLAGVMRFEKLKSTARKLPGVAAVTDLATGWIRKPENRVLPGRWWGRGAAFDSQPRTDKAD